MRNVVRALALSAIVCLVPGLARADGYVVPYFGAAMGGTVSDVDIFDEDRRPYVYGVCFGGMGAGIFGFEADLAFTPDFFGESDDNFLGGNSVTTVMGNVVIGAPIGGTSGAGVRPYVSGGVGLIRQRVEGFGDIVEFSSNNFGYNVGGGLFVFFGDSFGIRGDFRYFRNFQEDEDALFFFDLDAGTLNFTRATIGAVFRF